MNLLNRINKYSSLHQTGIKIWEISSTIAKRWKEMDARLFILLSLSRQKTEWTPFAFHRFELFLKKTLKS